MTFEPVGEAIYSKILGRQDLWDSSPRRRQPGGREQHLLSQFHGGILQEMLKAGNTVPVKAKGNCVCVQSAVPKAPTALLVKTC